MSKSARMRELFAQGHSVSEVSRLVGVDYAFAYGVAKRAGFVQSGTGRSRLIWEADVPSADHVDIEANLNTYLDSRNRTDRYASFDFCFNYFQRRHLGGRIHELGNGPELEIACLHLGFYLASWGMYRGSTALLQRSLAYLAPLIETIVRTPTAMWTIDADAYTPANCDLLLDAASRIRTAMPDGATDTLVTKIMLGVFGCVPAYDTNFRKGFGTAILGASSLMRIGRYYRDHTEVIERFRVPTLDFSTGLDTDLRYSRAKVIDMIFFVEGGASA